LYVFLISSMYATCPAHHILLDLITIIIFGEHNKLQNSSLFNYLQLPITSSLPGPNIHRTMLSNTSNYVVSLM
jgi:hypothetical protein